jgi:membrane protease YdiL (CAAX protease family)
MRFMVIVKATKEPEAGVMPSGSGRAASFTRNARERAGRWLGRGAAARTVTVLVTSALFAFAHLRDQGIPGAQQAAITGLVFGSIYALTGNLWPPIVAHAAFDLAAVAIIYWNLEARLAHLVVLGCRP